MVSAPARLFFVRAQDGQISHIDRLFSHAIQDKFGSK